MSVRFDGRVAIVTGAANGIGRAHALLLASRGAKVVVNDTGGDVNGKGADTKAADAVVKEITDHGGTAVASYDTVGDAKSAQAIVDTALKAFGKVDVLMNNAGILRDRSFIKMDLSDFEEAMRIHFYGAVYATKAVWPLMLEQKYGRLVFTSSSSGITGNFGQTNYGAAKTALIGFMHSLNFEGKKSNVLSNAISPVADTRMTKGIMPEKMVPWLRPEHIATSAVWLASENCTQTDLIINSAAGFFARIQFMRNDGVQFDPAQPVTLEMFDEKAAQITDPSTAKPLASAFAVIEPKLKDMGRL